MYFLACSIVACEKRTFVASKRVSNKAVVFVFMVFNFKFVELINTTKLQNYQQYAAGKAMMSAGEGGEGGSNPIVGGMGAGIGLGMAMSMAQKMQQPGQGVNPPAGEATASVEDRLKKLKSLKDAGVIDESEYNTKRTEILKDL